MLFVTHQCFSEISIYVFNLSIFVTYQCFSEVSIYYFSYLITILMSFSQLEKYLRDNPVRVPPTRQDRTVIVISDSKGRYLQRCIRDIEPENHIVWQFQGGRSSKQAADYVLNNIRRYLRRYRNILIVVWTGTCDLSKKIGKYVDLGNTTIDDIIIQYERVFDLNRIYGDNVKIIVLECPYYSISIWNSFKGHPDCSTFDHSDKLLHDKITELNTRIQILNESHSVVAPKFGLDLIKFRKTRNTHRPKTVSYSFLLDGIHPGVTLSKYWIRRLVISVIFRLCYQ